MAENGFQFNLGESTGAVEEKPLSGPISFGSVTSPGASEKKQEPERDSNKGQEDDAQEERKDEDDEPDKQFTPIVTLQKLDVPTGEEDEECIFEARCKMYWYGEGNAGMQWKDRGVGPLKLLKHNKSGFTRLLMRREQVFKLCANHRLSKEMDLQPMASSDKAWIYSCHADFSEPPEVQSITAAIRFKTEKDAADFKEIFNKSIQENIKLEAAAERVVEETDKADDVAVLTQQMAAVSIPESSDIAWANPPSAYMTYDDDAALGKPAPSLKTLQFIKGAPVTVGQGQVTCLCFFAKFAKGDYTTVVGINTLASAFPDVQFAGISLDPSMEDALSFIAKIGKSMPEIYINKLEVDYPLAWDDKTVKESFRKVSGLLSLGASATFLIDAKGTIVWREQFGQGHPPAKGQLGEQIRRLLKGEELLKNGDKPKDEADEESEEEEEEFQGGDDYDSDLGF